MSKMTKQKTSRIAALAVAFVLLLALFTFVDFNTVKADTIWDMYGGSSTGTNTGGTTTNPTYTKSKDGSIWFMNRPNTPSTGTSSGNLGTIYMPSLGMGYGILDAIYGKQNTGGMSVANPSPGLIYELSKQKGGMSYSSPIYGPIPGYNAQLSPNTPTYYGPSGPVVDPFMHYGMYYNNYAPQPNVLYNNPMQAGNSAFSRPAMPGVAAPQPIQPQPATGAYTMTPQPYAGGYKQNYVITDPNAIYSLLGERGKGLTFQPL